MAVGDDIDLCQLMGEGGLENAGFGKARAALSAPKGRSRRSRERITRHRVPKNTGHQVTAPPFLRLASPPRIGARVTAAARLSSIKIGKRLRQSDNQTGNGASASMSVTTSMTTGR